MIDRAAAKAWLRVETDDEDPVIDTLVGAAIATVEAQTGKFLSSKAFAQELRGFPCRYPYSIALTRGPVTEISALEYDPADGSAAATITDFRLSEGYGASFNGALQPAFGAVWPFALAGAGVVRISGTAGYADDEAPELDQACLLLVAHWYQNREAAIAGDRAGAIELPMGVQMLIGPYRAIGLG